MTRAAWSVFIFGIYVLLVGAALVLAPDATIAAFRLPPLSTGYTRVLGLLSLVIGVFDVIAARNEWRPYFRATVYTRFGFATGIAALVLIGDMPKEALPLGLTDVAGAIWTIFALGSSRKPAEA